MLALLALLAGPVQAGASALAARPPNVLLILADDLNVELGAYGSTLARTPNLDRLARRGLRFDRAYSQFPVCNPSRTSLLSGRRPETTGIKNNTTSPRTRLGDVAFLPEYFRSHGYRTLGVGKIAHWAETLRWDTYVAGRAEPEPMAEPEVRGATWRSVGQEDELIDNKRTQAALRLLREAAGGPFFLAVGFSLPHLPLIVPERYLALFPPEGIPVPAHGPPEFPAIAADGRSGLKDLSADEARRFRAGYLSAVSFVDSRVGLILDELDRRDLWRDIIVVFTSDHGFLLGEHGLWGKHTLFEEVARVPLLVAAPGVRGGAASARLVELVDLFPTLVELCRLPAPPGLEGTSFAPLLADPARAWKAAAFTSDQRGRAALSVRTERYRYTRWPRGDEELYDHGQDPAERRNLAALPAQRAALEEMRRILTAGWRAALPRP